MTWTLRDGEAWNERAPRSFFIPPGEHRRGLAPGRLVKLGFDCDDRIVDGQTYDGERMWLEVVEARGDGTYLGRLLNEPRIVTELRPGDSIEFEPRHVIAIEYTDGELGYDHQAWAIIDERIRSEDRPADFFAFQPGPPEGERMWWGHIGSDRPASAMTLGDLTDRWPQLTEVFQSDGGRWDWDPAEARYARRGEESSGR